MVYGRAVGGVPQMKIYYITSAGKWWQTTGNDRNAVSEWSSGVVWRESSEVRLEQRLDFHISVV